MKKTYIAVLTVVLLGLLFTNINSGNLNMKKTVKIKCTEMTCDGCKRSITKSISSLNGIIKLDINLETKIITVDYDDSKTTGEAILNAVFEAGYEAELAD